MKEGKKIQFDLFDGDNLKIMSPKELTIERWRNRKNVQNFLEKNHYLGRVQGWRYAFAIKYKNYIVGCATFGRPVARFEDQKKTLELTRFVLLDACPRNSESYILSKLLKILRKDGWKRFISYSDLEEGHSGTIYRATNWRKVGVVGGSDWRNRPGRICSVGKHKKIKWEYVVEY